jgi:hypothetical protein
MANLRILVVLLLIALIGTAAQAQTTTTSPTATPAVSAPQSTVTFNVSICDNRAAVSFNGVMQSGYSIYYQIFNSANQQLTALRQVSVSGNYNFSEVVAYTSSQTVAAGGGGYMTVSISRSGNPAASVYDSRATDVQDGCPQPESAIGTTTGGTIADVTDTTSTTSVGQTAQANSILSPFGGFLNPDYAPAARPLVVIGARDTLPPRQQTPGLIFAECNGYPVANPGLIYDTDNVVVFWSWYARTPELVQEHIDNANYEIGYLGSNPFIPPVEISEIQQRTRNYWVFYTVNLGRVKPGYYTIGYRLSWDNSISDGFEEFGPGTETERITGGCDFEVRANPQGLDVQYTFP